MDTDPNAADEAMLGIVRDAYSDLPDVPDTLRERAFSAFEHRSVPMEGRPAGDVANDVRRSIRLDRVLAAAAAGGHRVIEGRFSGSDPALTTSVAESVDGTLVATIESSVADSGVVTMSWTLVDDAGVGMTRRLATPLAATGSGFSASYNLGRVVDAAAVDLVPAEWCGWDQVDQEMIASTLQCVFNGSAQRAWRDALLAGRVPLEFAVDIRKVIDG